jgi:hypothetical protein
VLISWDPGGLGPVMAATWNITQLLFSQLPWDPGGPTSSRLEVKPIFKAGGLSATTLMGWPVGCYSWAVACSRARRGEKLEAYNHRKASTGNLAWNWTERRLRPRRRARRVLRV